MVDESSGRRAWPRITGQEMAVIGVPLAAAVAAWVWTAVSMMGMGGGLWDYPRALGLYTGTWTVMMTAMMVPAMVPAVAMGGRAASRRRALPPVAAATAVFIGAYLAVWTATGLLAYALLRVGGAVAGGLFAPAGPGRFLAAAVLLIAAVYQLWPAKRTCLARSCIPLTSLWEGGRPAQPRQPGVGGLAGALRAGLAAGGWCVGCSWALMAALVALGLMNLTWMIAIWVMVMAERLLPRRRTITLGVALVLAALAIALLAGVPVFPMQANMNM